MFEYVKSVRINDHHLFIIHIEIYVVGVRALDISIATVTWITPTLVVDLIFKTKPKKKRHER
jgi:hypothetical protein